jgi:hypothetical protein
MKKSLVLAAAATLFAAHAFANYWVVLRDGTRYNAKAKPVVTGNRATITLMSGGTLAVDPAQIDVAKSDEVTRLGGGELLAVEQTNTNATGLHQPNGSLGSSIKLRKLPSQAQQAPTAAPAGPAVPPIAATGGEVAADVIEKFTRAFENVGIFEHKITSTSKTALRCELTADSEEKVFNVLSAAAFLIVHNAGVPGAQIDMAEIFMKTTTGGSAGRFQMSQADAQALYASGVAPDRTKLQDYFVRKVIY